MAESLQAQIPESNGSTEAYRRSGRVYMLVLLFAAAVLNATDRGIFAIAMPAIKLEYRFTDSQLGLLGGVAFGVFYAIASLPIGYLATLLPRRNLLAICLAFWSAATTLTSLARGFISLFLARLSVGIGEAGGLGCIGNGANGHLGIYDPRPCAIAKPDNCNADCGGREEHRYLHGPTEFDDTGAAAIHYRHYGEPDATDRLWTGAVMCWRDQRSHGRGRGHGAGGDERGGGMAGGALLVGVGIGAAARSWQAAEAVIVAQIRWKRLAAGTNRSATVRSASRDVGKFPLRGGER
jgi:hypothetical protein